MKYRLAYCCGYVTISHLQQFFFSFGETVPPPVGHTLLIAEVSRSHTTMHYSR